MLESADHCAPAMSVAAVDGTNCIENRPGGPSVHQALLVADAEGRRSMLRLMLVLVALAVGLTAAAGPASPADSTAQVTAYAASLVPGGERPVPKGTRPDASGLFSAIVTQSGAKKTLAWTLSFGSLNGPAMAAHIHAGKAGQVGGIVVPLCQPCAPGARGKVVLSAKVAAAIANHGAYVNVHTKRNPGGEIRGQIGTSDALAAALDTQSEAPPAKGVPAGAKGSFSALVIDVGARPLVVWSLDFGGLTGPGIAAHVHLGKAGVAGPVSLALCGPCTSGVHGRKAIDAGLATAMESAGTYVNVHTATNPAGEIRGQLGHATQGVAARSTPLGSILVDDRGKTLYMFEADKGTQSACYGRCAVFWPPAFAYGVPVAGDGTQASLLGAADRTDGTTMLTYGGYPLYGFLPDTQPGDMKGQGSPAFGAPWWVLAPATGKVITTKPS
jgi:predicted lipoprotein with Yx(FWY)xxD motif